MLFAQKSSLTVDIELFVKVPYFLTFFMFANYFLSLDQLLLVLSITIPPLLLETGALY